MKTCRYDDHPWTKKRPRVVKKNSKILVHPTLSKIDQLRYYLVNPLALMPSPLILRTFHVAHPVVHHTKGANFVEPGE